MSWCPILMHCGVKILGMNLTVTLGLDLSPDETTPLLSAMRRFNEAAGTRPDAAAS